MKKRLSILLVSLFVFAVGVAEAVYADGYFRYEIAQNTITIQGFSGQDATVWVPEEIAGRKVVAIASGAFSSNEDVSQIRLPTTVATIEAGAFRRGQAISYYTIVKEPTDAESDDSPATQGDTVPEQTPAGSAVSEQKSVQESRVSEQQTVQKEPVVAVKSEQKPTESVSEKTEKKETEKKETEEESSADTEEVPAEPVELETGVAMEKAEEEEAQKVWYGIWTEKYHSTVSVDDMGRLVIVDEEGRVTRIDDSRTYTLYNTGNGFSIQDNQGEWVTVDEEGNVFVPARGGQVDLSQISNYLIAGVVLMGLVAGVGFYIWRRKA